MKRRAFEVLTFTLALAFASPVLADDPTSQYLQVPALSSSLPPSSIQPVAFEIWDQAVGGGFVSSEAHIVDTDDGSNITNDDGFSDLLLGRPAGLDPNNFPNGSSRYLDVTQAGASVLGARWPLYAAAFLISFGPPGPQGEAGPIGVVGPVGSMGSTGSTGPQGIAGIQGAPGAAGATGSLGPIGPVGPTGATGSQGLAGVQGAHGPTGGMGSVGPTGLVGPTGASGQVGDVGSEGLNPLRVVLLKWSPAYRAASFAVGAAPWGIAFDGTSIWVTNSGSNSVTKLRASDGAYLGT